MCLQDGDRVVDGTPEENIGSAAGGPDTGRARDLRWRRVGDHAWDSTL